MEELLQQVAGLHESTNTSPTPPSLIIVDRLEGYLSGLGFGSSNGYQLGEHSCAARLSALLLDTSVFLTQRLQECDPSLAPCRVIVSFQSERDTRQETGEASATDPILDVLDRYFQTRCTLCRDGSPNTAQAGLQELWHIYFSGKGVAGSSSPKDCDDKQGLAQEWQLLLYPEGLVQFKLV